MLSFTNNEESVYEKEINLFEENIESNNQIKDLNEPIKLETISLNEQKDNNSDKLETTNTVYENNVEKNDLFINIPLCMKKNHEEISNIFQKNKLLDNQTDNSSYSFYNFFCSYKPSYYLIFNAYNIGNLINCSIGIHQQIKPLQDENNLLYLDSKKYFIYNLKCSYLILGNWLFYSVIPDIQLVNLLKQYYKTLWNRDIHKLTNMQVFGLYFNTNNLYIFLTTGLISLYYFNNIFSCFLNIYYGFVSSEEEFIRNLLYIPVEYKKWLYAIHGFLHFKKIILCDLLIDLLNNEKIIDLLIILNFMKISDKLKIFRKIMKCVGIFLIYEKLSDFKCGLIFIIKVVQNIQLRITITFNSKNHFSFIIDVIYLNDNWNLFHSKQKEIINKIIN